MSDDFFDFGFTLCDESELDAVQQATSQAAQQSQTAEQLDDKINKLYNAILPLLANLKKDPDKPYIKWENRLDKIEQFETHLQTILRS